METKPDSIPRAQGLNNISELAGEYYLIGTFNDTTRELFKDMDSAKDFKVKIECSDNQATFDFVYQDTVEHKEQSVLSKFDLTDEGPAVLQSPMATLMLKQYKGDQDLIVHYFDKAKGNIVLVQRDMMIMYFLSKEGKPSEESFPVRKIVKDLGLQTEAYKPINNS